MNPISKGITYKLDKGLFELYLVTQNRHSVIFFDIQLEFIKRILSVLKIEQSTEI